MNTLQFNINWDDINNPYNDTTNPIPMNPLFPSRLELRRQFGHHYTLYNIVYGHYQYDLDYAGHVIKTPLNSRELYSNIKKFISNVNYEFDTKEPDINGNLIDKYTPAEISAINLDLTQDISNRILNLMSIENRQSLLNTYILIYSSLPLVLPQTPANKQIIIQTIQILLNNVNIVNINPLILPIYSSIENMTINTINNQENDALLLIYINRAFIIDCLEEIYNIFHQERYNIFLQDLSDTFIDPLVNIILDYEFLNLKDQILNLEDSNTLRQIDITQPLNFNMNTEKDMRLYTLKLNSNFLQNI